MDPLIVYWETKRVGHVWIDPNRAFVFQYHKDWLTNASNPPISIGLPLKETPYDSNSALPFFSNLLPEANVRTLIARKLGISEDNDFKLLEALGGDCAGALSLRPSNEAPIDEGSYEELSAQDLERMIKEMPRHPLISPAGGFRLSLAGAQDKLAVFIKGNQFFLPRGSKASSHILKPPMAHIPHSVENEAFVTCLARQVGLSAPNVSIHKNGSLIFISERYDRQTDNEGNLHRLHQEDFCQSLRIDYHRKYETEGGPGLEACFKLIDRASMEPALDKRRALQWTLFNYLCGNNDAHAKNIAFLFSQTGVRLAPFYDLLSTAVYPDVNQKMAMKIGGENRADWVTKRHWERLAENASVSPRIVFDLGRAMAKIIPTALSNASNDISKMGIKPGIILDIKNLIEKRARRLLTTLG